MPENNTKERKRKDQRRGIKVRGDGPTIKFTTKVSEGMQRGKAISSK